MKQLLLRRTLMAIAALVVGIFPQATLHALIWNETSDAGGIASTAQAITGPGPLVTINGSFATGNDFDVYRFSITNAALFSAATTSTADTLISLFTASGTGIAFNDDISGTNLNSQLPAGNALYASLSPGDYLLGISRFSNVAATSGLAAIFNDVAPFTAISGPINPGIFAGQTNGGPTTTTPVQYSITLTGAAAVPEPGTWITGAGLLAAAATRLLRRKRFQP